MHIEIGIISPEKLAYAGVAATALLGAHTLGLLKSPAAWLRTALAAFFFSVLMHIFLRAIIPAQRMILIRPISLARDQVNTVWQEYTG